MQNTPFIAGPIALTATLTTNILNPAAATGGVNGGSAGQVIIVKHIRVANKTNALHNFTLYKGATGANAAGTELFVAKNVAENDVFDHYCYMKLTTADFIVGGADALTSLTITFEGEVGVAG